VNTLTLAWLRSLQFPVRDASGKCYMTKRFQWRWCGNIQSRPLMKHWELTFDVNRWEWYIELAPEKQETDDGRNPDPNWDQSKYVIMWMGNHDPNRFLVGIELREPKDLTRFLDAFKLEYREEQAEAQP
jgi:hypothetical protein